VLLKSCLIFHLTCLVYIHYLGKRQDHKNHEFGLRLLISPMIGTLEVNYETLINGRILTVFKSTVNKINTKNCSLSIVLTATDQKPQKSLKR